MLKIIGNVVLVTKFLKICYENFILSKTINFNLTIILWQPCSILISRRFMRNLSISRSTCGTTTDLNQ